MRCFEDVVRLGLGKEGMIWLRGMVSACKLEAITGVGSGGTSRSDFGFVRFSSTLVSLRDAPCCDVEVIIVGGGAT